LRVIHFSHRRPAGPKPRHECPRSGLPEIALRRCARRGKNQLWTPPNKIFVPNYAWTGDSVTARGHEKCGNAYRFLTQRHQSNQTDFWTGVEKSGGSQAKVKVNNVEPFLSTSVSTGVDRSTSRRKQPNEPKAPVDQYSPLVIRRKIDFNKRPMAVGGAVAATQGTSPSHSADILPRRDGEP